MNNNKLLGAVFLSLAASIWGGMFVVVKLVVSTVPPVELVWLRYIIAIIVLLIISRIQRDQWKVNKRDLILIFIIGLVGNAISIVAQETGTWLSSAQTGAVITSATPTFMLFFGFIILKERLDSVKVTSIIMATIGVIMIVGVNLTGTHILLGTFSLIIAAITWALMSVLIKLLSSNYNSIQVTILSTGVAIALLTPYIISHHQVMATIPFGSPRVFLSLLYLGVISTALAFVMWNKGLRLMNAASSGLFFLFQPIVGTLLGYIFLKEPLSVGFLSGFILIIASVWVSIRFAK